MPTDPTSDAIRQLLDALQHPGAIDAGLAAHLSQQLHELLENTPRPDEPEQP